MTHSLLAKWQAASVLHVTCCRPVPLVLRPFVSSGENTVPAGDHQEHAPRRFVTSRCSFSPPRDTDKTSSLLATCQTLIASRQTVGVRCTGTGAGLGKPKAVFFDMDATAIREESLVSMAKVRGQEAQIQEITDRAMAGSLDFTAAVRARVALLAGMPIEDVLRVAASLTPMPGLREFVSTAKQLGVPCFLISGGFVQLVELLSHEIGFSGFHASKLAVAGGKLTGALEGSIVDGDAKQNYLIATCAKLGVDPSEVVAVGDGANDLLMLQAAGMAVGHSPKDILWPHLDAANWEGDHRFLLPLLFD